MSWQATAWVSGVEAGGASGKLLLYALANYADEHGRCYPGDERIMRDTELSERAVRDWKRKLVEAGLIRVERRRKPGGDFDLDVIVLAMAEPPANPAGGTTGKSRRDHRQMVPPPPANGAVPPTPPYKAEPSVEPSGEPEREGAGGREETEPARASTDDPRKFEKRIKRIVSETGWKGWETSSTAWTVLQFARLTDAQRAEAEALAQRYYARAAGKHVPLGVYFRDKKWSDLPEQVIEQVLRPPPAPRLEPPFGPVWAELRCRELPFGPLPPGAPETTRETRLAGYEASCRLMDPERAAVLYRRMGHDITPDGTLLFPDDFEAQIARRHEREAGYPVVARLDKAAAEGRSIAPPPDFRACGVPFEAVPVGSAVWAAWEAFFAARNWPWLPDPGRQRVVFFPVGGPDGWRAFEAAVRGAEHDGGGRQAAE